jgi:hypothetical protein
MMKCLVPIARIGDGREQRCPQPGELARLDERDGGGDGDQDNGERGQQPPSPPYPEVPQAQPPVFFPVAGQ